MTQTTAPARAPERVIPSSALEFVGDSSGTLAADMIKSFPNAERIIVETSTTVTKRSMIVVLETRYRRPSATSANSIPAHKPAPIVAAPPPVPVVQVAPTPNKNSISMEAVQRIIKRKVHMYTTVLGISNPTIIRWGTRPDGRPFGLIENPRTGIRYAWTLNPATFDLIDLGAVDL